MIQRQQNTLLPLFFGKRTVIDSLKLLPFLFAVYLAIEIIEAAEKRGDISPDKTTLIEFTSGNTGVAMAAFAALF